MLGFSSRRDVLQPMVEVIVDQPVEVPTVLMFEPIVLLVVQSLYLMLQLVMKALNDLQPGVRLLALQLFDVYQMQYTPTQRKGERERKKLKQMLTLANNILSTPYFQLLFILFNRSTSYHHFQCNDVSI